MNPTFKRHFRVYLVNNHPAYIVDEEGNKYIFHRMTKSKTSGGKKNWKLQDNPIKGCSFTCYMVKSEQKAKKTKFSREVLQAKKGSERYLSFIKRVNKK